jgi:hypothetical protein
MAATSVSICSNALLRLGAQTIASLSESNDRARLAANLYDTVRDSTLRSHPWNCAVKRVFLAPDSTVPAFDFTAQFTLPSDWLKTLQVGQDGFEVEYRTESGKIMASGTSLALRYIWRNTVESTWDAMLVEAMELAMAAAMAYGITKSASMVEVAQTALKAHMKLCRAADGQDDPPDTLGDFPLMQSRFGGAFRYGPGR